jgi:anti-repressor protein
MEVQRFNSLNEGFSLRTVEKDGEAWFLASDVCAALDLGNIAQAGARLDDDEKGLISNDTPGGEQKVSIVSEAGLYSLVLGSRKPEAKAFKRWVTHEVLPKIRKTGQYAIATPRNLPEALRLAADLAEKLEAAQPAVEFVARYVEAENTKGLREVAKVLGIPPVKFSTWLVDAGILFRQGAKLLPYSEHMDKGRFEVKTGEKNGHAFHQTRFTPEGIAWIAKRSKECV